MTRDDDVKPASGHRDKAALLSDIARQRAQLGDTVTTLSGKLDVKSRASNRIRALADDLKATTRTRPEIVTGAGIVLLSALGLARKVHRR
jgi:ABC-type transporter Mla subunit MlaD